MKGPPPEIDRKTGLPKGWRVVTKHGDGVIVRRVGTYGDPFAKPPKPAWADYDPTWMTWEVRALEADRAVYGDCYATEDGRRVCPDDVLCERVEGDDVRGG